MIASAVCPFLDYPVFSVSKELVTLNTPLCIRGKSSRHLQRGTRTSMTMRARYLNSAASPRGRKQVVELGLGYPRLVYRCCSLGLLKSSISSTMDCSPKALRSLRVDFCPQLHLHYAAISQRPWDRAERLYQLLSTADGARVEEEDA